MDEIVHLNVGGCTMYTTKRSTLIRYKNSLLFKKFQLLRFNNDKVNGAYFIDGDGSIFRHVLNFLRRGRLTLPEDFKEWELLASEADFYQIEDLVEAVKAKKFQRDTYSS
ncbi:BTB/POZ domain-containing protein KCTD6-like [Patiria miniata]|uniref:BTB domain-containing protein n=1 Tax=Patiria miniata TaxID=46514 RepID=A0A913ZKK7_PATMI|nr:BTB/POZ domain-containing protein KCTD6-like [Patiria miniata]